MKNPGNHTHNNKWDEEIPGSTSLMFICGEPLKMFMNEEKVKEARVLKRDHHKPRGCNKEK